MEGTSIPLCQYQRVCQQAKIVKQSRHSPAWLPFFNPVDAITAYMQVRTDPCSPYKKKIIHKVSFVLPFKKILIAYRQVKYFFIVWKRKSRHFFGREFSGRTVPSFFCSLQTTLWIESKKTTESPSAFGKNMDNFFPTRQREQVVILYQLYIFNHLSGEAQTQHKTYNLVTLNIGQLIFKV